MKAFVIGHYVQRDILRTLSRAENLRFSELKPTSLENNIFMYHLGRLLRAKLVYKTDHGYTLTPDGMRYVARVTRTNLDLQPQPKLYSLLVIRNDQGAYIMHRRSAQPFRGRLTFPGGAIFYDEELAEHTTRQLQEKVGLSVLLTHRGMASLRLGRGSEVLSHTYAHIFYAEVIGSPALASKDDRFTPSWIKPAEILPTDMLPDVQAIIEQLEGTPEYFFLELKYISD